MLYLVGLGLQKGDISGRGIKALKEADIAYAEIYTNAIDHDLEALEKEAGTEIEVLDRTGVENEDMVLEQAEENDVGFLVSGDPLAATTHQDILFRARERGIETEVVHAPSVFTAVAEAGLSLYKFGRTTTLTLQNGDLPPSVLEAVEMNREEGLHTLVLVDPEMPLGGMMEAFADFWDGEVVICSGLGTGEAEIAVGGLEEVQISRFDHPISIVVPGEMSDNEEERLQRVK
ncbi:MAG: diphthine synthase [Candidatus Nanohaloarchaeota archaeon QJJ-7]|nr:diphthine synthase [Candidatus Nanohaloarchaeota archaeon QJJ-7]